ncbi:glycosyl hydrolase family 28-related protein [Priestia aryabhattai]|uniref:glycosyl hydrolase family 28-related protein n=1 Tax=Priestia aryabhattai TaxID=412384 RepID=UPI000532CAB6|nr:glycosyl hydrolase family 28-related protein [Priestia aryabhattai]
MNKLRYILLATLICFVLFLIYKLTILEHAVHKLENTTEKQLHTLGLNVKDFGAKGDYNFDKNQGTDDTLAIKKAIREAKLRKINKIIFPSGNYLITDTLPVSKKGNSLGVIIEGVSPESTTIVSGLNSSKPLFSFEKTRNNIEGWDEPWSNAGLKNLRIQAKERELGTGIYIDGCVFCQFENVRITNMKYGIWLHNNELNSYTEANIFQNLRLDFNKNAIRIQQGKGNQSFHGNIFEHIFINVKPGQVGLNLVSGYLYNSRFDLIMWGQKNTNGTQPTNSNRPVYVNADGIGENNVGNITVESYGESILTGKGKFQWAGTLTGIGGQDQEIVYKDYSKEGFSCDNCKRIIKR